MSADNPRREAIETAHDQYENGETEAAFQTLLGELDHMHSRVDDLETRLDNRAKVDWNSTDYVDADLESTTGQTIPLGSLLHRKVDPAQLEDLENRLQAVEDGEVDVIVRGEFDGSELPIERKIAERKAGGDLQANEARATLIFPKFGGYAETRGGSKLVIDSKDVRSILQETTDKTNWPNETIKRAINRTAELTSRRDTKQDWDPEDDENLLTLQRARDGTLELHADREEFQAFYRRREEGSP